MQIQQQKKSSQIKWILDTKTCLSVALCLWRCTRVFFILFIRLVHFIYVLMFMLPLLFTARLCASIKYVAT